jgi:hypothetical protein
LEAIAHIFSQFKLTRKFDANTAHWQLTTDFFLALERHVFMVV